MAVCFDINSTALARVRIGDGVDGGVIGVNARIDRSIGDVNTVCRSRNDGKYVGLPMTDGTRRG